MVFCVLCVYVAMSFRPYLRELWKEQPQEKIVLDKNVWGDAKEKAKNFISNLSEMKIESGVNYNIEDATAFVETYEIWENSLEKTYLAKEKLPESLRVTVGGGTLTIEPTTENAIYIEAEGGFRLQGFVEDGVLEIIMVSKSSFASDYEPAKVTLYLPEGLNFFKAEFGLGAGEILVNGLSAATLEIDVDAGAMEMTDVVALDADLYVSAGSMKFAGDVKKTLLTSITAGSIALEMEGSVNDFNYYASEVAGGIVLDGESVYTEEDEAAKIDNGATESMDLYCTMGEIKVDFTLSENN